MTRLFLGLSIGCSFLVRCEEKTLWEAVARLGGHLGGHGTGKHTEPIGERILTSHLEIKCQHARPPYQTCSCRHMIAHHILGSSTLLGTEFVRSVSRKQNICTGSDKR